jgi:hypothetical protein
MILRGAKGAAYRPVISTSNATSCAKLTEPTGRNYLLSLQGDSSGGDRTRHTQAWTTQSVYCCSVATSPAHPRKWPSSAPGEPLLVRGRFHHRGSPRALSHAPAAGRSR